MNKELVYTFKSLSSQQGLSLNINRALRIISCNYKNSPCSVRIIIAYVIIIAHDYDCGISSEQPKSEIRSTMHARERAKIIERGHCPEVEER